MEIRTALERVVEARARFAAAQVELQQATRSLEIANVRYRAGRASNVELTDAQVELATAGADVANARYDYLTQARALEHATGATFTEILAQPPAPVRPGGEVP